MAQSNSRIVTIPNVISLIRLALVPVFLWLLWKPDPSPVAAAALLAFLGATDWVDGYIARHFNQSSELGKVLDPTADRALLVAAAIAILVEDISLPVNIIMWIVIVRDVVVAIAVIALGLAGAKRIDVVWAGKAGTLAIMFALPMFLAAHAIPSWRIPFNIGGWGFAIGGIILGYYAAAKYIPAAREALAEGRAARAASQRSTSEARA